MGHWVFKVDKTKVDQQVYFDIYLLVNLFMTTLTVDIENEKDLPVLKEILNRLGLSYKVETDRGYIFSESAIKDLLQTKQDFLDGKTTARNWDDIEDDLNRAYS
jgi:hypothetical protein